MINKFKFNKVMFDPIAKINQGTKLERFTFENDEKIKDSV